MGPRGGGQREGGNARGRLGGGRAVREPPLRGVGRTVECDGRPQGSPLREEGRGRGMGPRIREDNGRGEMPGVGWEGKGRFANRPYGGLAERLNVTGDHKGRPYGRKGGDGGWVPASARTREGKVWWGARWLACGIAGAAAGGGSRCLPEPRSSCRRTLPSDSRGPTCPP